MLVDNTYGHRVINFYRFSKITYIKGTSSGPEDKIKRLNIVVVVLAFWYNFAHVHQTLDYEYKVGPIISINAIAGFQKKPY